jgi:hypothetical protein
MTSLADVEPVLDSPVPLEPGGGGLGLASVIGREQTRVDHLNMLPALDSPGASDLDHLSGCGEVHSGGSLNLLDSTSHPPTVTGVDA